MLKIPEVLNDFRVYDEGEELVGQNADITLPEFNSITDTINGAGIMGEIEDSVIGQFESATTNIKWNCLSEPFFHLVSTVRPLQLTFRGAMQIMDRETGHSDLVGLKIVIRGKSKTVNLGKFEKAKKNECETDIETIYIKITSGRDVLFELDKLNYRFVVNNEDQLEKLKSMI